MVKTLGLRVPDTRDPTIGVLVFGECEIECDSFYTRVAGADISIGRPKLSQEDVKSIEAACESSPEVHRAIENLVLEVARIEREAR